MSDRIYRYLGPRAKLTLEEGGVEQNFLRFEAPDTNLGCRADNDEIAAEIEGRYADVFSWDDGDAV